VKEISIFHSFVYLDYTLLPRVYQPKNRNYTVEFLSITLMHNPPGKSWLLNSPSRIHGSLQGAEQIIRIERQEEITSAVSKRSRSGISYFYVEMPSVIRFSELASVMRFQQNTGYGYSDRSRVRAIVFQIMRCSIIRDLSNLGIIFCQGGDGLLT